MTDSDQKTTKNQAAAPGNGSSARQVKKEVPAGISYVNTPNLLNNVLKKIIEAQVPDRLTQDYLGTVWGFTGGSAKAMIPLLKRVGFLHSDGTPTEAYSRFRTLSGQSHAAKEALHSGFPEVFRRNEHAENANDHALTDIVVEVTGREKSDPLVRAIVGTFKVFAGYIDKSATRDEKILHTSVEMQSPERNGQGISASEFALSYQINIVLPETTNVDVYNSIFKSLRENLLP